MLNHIEIEPTSINHVAIIMDGNNRWAKKRGLKGIDGHKVGAEKVRDILNSMNKYDISMLTLFAFSSENWRRPKSEVLSLMSLLTSYLKKESKNLTKKNIKLRIIGRRDRFSLKLNRLIQETEAVTKNGKRTLILALDYGGKWEISEATKKIAHQIKSNQIEPDDINEDVLSENMCIEDFPPPDICIRTGGEKRISNFLLWHMAYTELYFTDCFWPDFDAATFDSAILDYQKRQRRFGKRDEVSSGKGNKCAQTAN